MTTVEQTSQRALRPMDWLIAGALAAVVVCRVWPSLDPSSLWIDDAWQALVARTRSSRDGLLIALTAPGYALLLKSWFGLVGFSELKAQLPSLAFAAALPGATYLVARSKHVSTSSALVGGALLAASPVLLVYATRVKQFSLDAILALALVSVAWHLIEQGGSVRRWSALLASAIVATLVSGVVAPVALGVLLASAAAAFTRSPSEGRRGLGALAGYGVFGLMWWLAFLRNAANPILRSYWDGYFIDVGSFGAAVEDTAVALVRFVVGLAELPVWLAAPGLFLAAVVLARHARTKAALFLFPLAIALTLAAMRLAPLGTGRTDLYLFPAVALLVSVSLDQLGVAIKKGLVITILGGLALVFAVSIGDQNQYPNEDIRPLVEILDELPDESRVAVYRGARWAYALYTNRPLTFARSESEATGFLVEIGNPGVTVLGNHFDQPELYRSELSVIVEDRDSVWFVASNMATDVLRIERQFADMGFQVTARWDRPGATLRRYER